MRGRRESIPGASRGARPVRRAPRMGPGQAGPPIPTRVPRPGFVPPKTRTARDTPRQHRAPDAPPTPTRDTARTPSASAQTSQRGADVQRDAPRTSNATRCRRRRGDVDRDGLLQGARAQGCARASYRDVFTASLEQAIASRVAARDEVDRVAPASAHPRRACAHVHPSHAPHAGASRSDTQAQRATKQGEGQTTRRRRSPRR